MKKKNSCKSCPHFLPRKTEPTSLTLRRCYTPNSRHDHDTTATKIIG